MYKRQILGCAEHRAWAAELADKCVTLVKDREGLLPLSPAKTPRVKLIAVTNEKVEPGDVLPEVKLLRQLLEREGFQVSYFKDSAYPGAGLSLADYRKAVSYTHLDVYKRQLLPSSSRISRLRARLTPFSRSLSRRVNGIPSCCAISLQAK